MFPVEVLFLGFALAMDAAVVSFALGVLSINLSREEKIRRGFMVAVLFGLFQFLMLWLGSYGGFLFSFSKFGYLTQFIVSIIFLVIGLKLFQESVANDENKKDLEWKLVPMLLMGLITSIDALAAGVSLGTLPMAHVAAIEVGAITFFMVGLFFALSQFLHHIPEKWLLRLAGLIFTYLGLEIIWKYYLQGIV